MLYITDTLGMFLGWSAKEPLQVLTWECGQPPKSVLKRAKFAVTDFQIAAVLSDALGVEILPAFPPRLFQEGEMVLVVVLPPLPEGVLKLPAGATIRWRAITLRWPSLCTLA